MAQPEFVTGYRVSSGEIFTDYREAEARQAKLDFWAWCNANICVGGEWSATMVADAIWEAWDLNPRPQDAA